MNETVKKIAGTGVFTALVVVLQLFSNYVQFGPVSVNLAIIPIVIGAIVYGPISGLFLGLVDGAMVLVAPSTAFFLGYNVWATYLLCYLKTGLAGLAAGFIPKLIKRNDKVACIVASTIVPIINTGLFALGCYMVFMPLFKESIEGFNHFGDIFTMIIGWNFFVEFGTIVLLTPAIYYIYTIIKKNILAHNEVPLASEDNSNELEENKKSANEDEPLEEDEKE